MSKQIFRTFFLSALVRRRRPIAALVLSAMTLLSPPSFCSAAPPEKSPKTPAVKPVINGGAALPKKQDLSPPPAAKSAPAEAQSGDKPKSNGLKSALQLTPATGAGGPLYIKSDTLELNSKDRIFTYKGNVEVVRDDVTITAAIVEGQYDEQNRIETVLCKENVVITKGDSMKATANRALYKVAAATIELTEGPELYREGNALQADKVIVYINEDRSEAEGNVRVKVIKPADAAQG